MNWRDLSDTEFIAMYENECGGWGLGFENKDELEACVNRHNKLNTKRKRRESLAFSIPAAALFLILSSKTSAKINKAFLFELLDSVKYDNNTTAKTLNSAEISPEKVRIFAGGRDYISKGDFYDDRLKSFELFEFCKNGNLKPSQTLIYALTAHHTLKGFNFTGVSEAEMKKYKLTIFVDFKNADFIALERGCKESKGINREFALRTFIFMLAFSKAKHKSACYNLRAFKIKHLRPCFLNPKLKTLLSRFFVNMSVEIKKDTLIIGKRSVND